MQETKAKENISSQPDEFLIVFPHPVKSYGVYCQKFDCFVRKCKIYGCAFHLECAKSL
jgi:hypothetical protein